MTNSTGTDTAEPSDEALMEELCADDDAALGRLMARWETPVKGFVLRMGVPDASVEDVAQETFVRLYQHRSKYRRGSRFKPWLLTIAANLARNAHRWSHRHPSESLQALGETNAHAPELKDPASLPPIDRLASLDLAERVRASVNELPVALREALVLVEFEELSYSEAAAVLGCSIKSVETRLYRARNQLREKLRPELHELSLR